MSEKLIPCGIVTDKNQITAAKVTVEYMQEPDSNSSDLQTLEISTEDAGAGTYYVLKSDRWAFDNMEELINVLKDFEKRLK